MIKIIINEKEYELKYTLESWKKLKSEHGITPSNFQIKAEEDLAETVSAMTYYGIEREKRNEIDVNVLDECLDFTALDVISLAVIESMPKSSRKKAQEISEGKEAENAESKK